MLSLTPWRTQRAHSFCIFGVLCDLSVFCHGLCKYWFFFFFFRKQGRTPCESEFSKGRRFFLDARGKALPANQKLDCKSFSPPVCRRLTLIFLVFIFEDTWVSSWRAQSTADVRPRVTRNGTSLGTERELKRGKRWRRRVCECADGFFLSEWMAMRLKKKRVGSSKDEEAQKDGWAVLGHLKIFCLCAHAPNCFLAYLWKYTVR